MTTETSVPISDQWIPVYRPALLPRETLIWQRDPYDFVSEIPVTRRRRIYTAVCFVIMLWLAHSVFDDSLPLLIGALVVALLLAWQTLYPWQTRLKGGLMAHTLTDKRLILAPWRVIKPSDVSDVQTRQDKIQFKIRGQTRQFGPVKDPEAVAAKIKAAAGIR